MATGSLIGISRWSNRSWGAFGQSSYWQPAVAREIKSNPARQAIDGEEHLRQNLGIVRMMYGDAPGSPLHRLH